MSLEKQMKTGQVYVEFGHSDPADIAYEKVTDLIKFDKDADIYMGDQSKATIGLIEADELLNAVEASVGTL